MNICQTDSDFFLITIILHFAHKKVLNSKLLKLLFSSVEYLCCESISNTLIFLWTKTNSLDLSFGKIF